MHHTTSEFFPPNVRTALQRAADIVDPTERLRAINAATNLARRQYGEMVQPVESEQSMLPGLPTWPRRV